MTFKPKNCILSVIVQEGFHFPTSRFISFDTDYHFRNTINTINH